MAAGDRVQATRNIQSFVQQGQTMTLKADAIPSGSKGTVVVEDTIQGVISVKFDNGVTGNFGSTLVDKNDSIELAPLTGSVSRI